MPTIPSADQLQRITPKSGKQIAAVPRRQYAGEGQGAQQMAQVVSQSADRMAQFGLDLVALHKRREEREEKLGLHKAEAYLASEKAKYEAHIGSQNDEERDQYGSYAGRYEEGMKGAFETASEMVKTDYSKQLLTDKFGLALTTGAINMEKKALGMETDKGRAETQDILDSHLESASKNNSLGAADMFKHDIEKVLETSRELGYINYQEKEKIKDATLESYATTRLTGMSSEEQAEALSTDKGWVTSIPASKRVVYKKRADEAVKREKEAGEADAMKAVAINQVDDWKDEDLDPVAMREQAEAKYKNNPKQRLYVESRIETYEAQKNKADTQELNDVASKWFTRYRLGEEKENEGFAGDSKQFWSFNDIPDAELEVLSRDSRVLDSIKAIADESLNKRAVPQVDPANLSDLKIEVTKAEDTGDWGTAENIYRAMAKDMTPKTRTKFEDIFTSKAVPKEFKGIIPVEKEMESMLKDIGNRNDKQVAELMFEYRNWYERRYEETGKEPSRADLVQYRDGLFTRIDTPGMGYDEYAYEDKSLNPYLVRQLYNDHIKMKKKQLKEEGKPIPADETLLAPDEDTMRYYYDNYKGRR